MSKNKKIQSGSFEVNKRKYFTRRNFAFVLFILILATGTYFRLKQKPDKTISSAVTIDNIADEETPSWWLRQYFGIGVCDNDYCQKNADPDADKLTNAQEYYYHGDPYNPDTNKNGLTDGEDVAQGFDPSLEGKVSFDAAEAQISETAIGESLVFDKDLIKTAGELATIQNIVLPEISDAELNISKDNKKANILKYLNESNDLLKQFFPADVSGYIENMASAWDNTTILDLKKTTLEAETELKKLSVPSDAVMIQKYQLGMLRMLPLIMSVPTDDELKDNTNVSANNWYDNTRTFSYLLQRISIETLKLQNKYK